MAERNDDRTMTLNGRGARAVPKPVRFADRYTDQGLLGAGGMGEVRRVYDDRLERMVAIKLIHGGRLQSKAARDLFLAEARLTAGLQHPGVVAVHDLGVLPDGRAWFTMREVEGRTLAEALAAEDLPFRRQVDVLARVASVVAFAHAAGVIHRDIKPGNIMLGRFGEVYLVDWGIATLMRTGGTLSGSPAYMAPEQALSLPTSTATDVFALGLLLREVLTSEGPPDLPVEAILARAAHGPPPPLCDLPLDRAELGELVNRILVRAPSDRPSADAVVRSLEAWLDGARTLERARQMVEEAIALRPRLLAQRQRIDALQGEAAAHLAALPPRASDDERAVAWALEDEAARDSQKLAEDEVAHLRLLQGALSLQPSLLAAHEALALFYRAVAERAEALGDAVGLVQATALVRAHDQRGVHAAWLAGDGALTLHADPEGVEVWVRAYTSDRRVLVAGPPRSMGIAPVVAQVLARGSHVLELVRPGQPAVRYPVSIERGGHWRAVPPDQLYEQAIPLPTALPPEEVYVPAGWCVSGGDPQATDGLTRRRLWVDGFVVQRFCVTEADYAAWLNVLIARGQSDEAQRHVPEPDGQKLGSAFDEDADGRYHPQPGHERWPVCRVSWHDAMAYAAWRAAETGLPWRLPHDQEWEKAARGVDGRPWPWGDHVEVDRACMFGSLPGPPSRTPVDDWPLDESPYGVRGMAGGVRDWCLNGYDRLGPPDGSRVDPLSSGDGPRMTRGGAWAAMPVACRLAGRFAAPPESRLLGVGFRLVRSWPTSP